MNITLTDSLYWQVWQVRGPATASYTPILIAAFIYEGEAKRYSDSLQCKEWGYEVRHRGQS